LELLGIVAWLRHLIDISRNIKILLRFFAFAEPFFPQKESFKTGRFLEERQGFAPEKEQ